MKKQFLILLGGMILLGLAAFSTEKVDQMARHQTTPVRTGTDLDAAGTAIDSRTAAASIAASGGGQPVDGRAAYRQSPDDASGPGLPLFTFGRDEPGWYTVDDNVMGGVSNSIVVVDTDLQRLSFSGSVSLEKNGGFASTRSQWAGYDLGDFDGIALRVRGDGSTYRFRIRTQNTGPDIAYTALFETESNRWQDVYIPFREMVPLYRGFLVNIAGPLDPQAIRSFGLMVSDKQEGEFSLEVDWINAVNETRREYGYASSGADIKTTVTSLAQPL